MKCLSTRILGLAALVPLLLPVQAGCAARAQVTPDEVTELRERISELERSHGRLRVRLEDAESRTYLLQDRVEANRIALQSPRRMGASQPDTRAEAPSRYQPGTGQASSLSSRSSSGRQLPDLPVEHWSPEEGDREPSGQGSEVVINQERYDATFSSEQGSRSSAPSGNGQRAALPPVVTSGERLTVTGSNQQNAPGADTLALYQEGLQLFHEREYDSARQRMLQVLELGPPPSYTDNALYWIGECYYGVGRYDDALRYFQRVVNEHAGGNKAADSMLKVALTHERLGDVQAAVRTLRTLVDSHPGHPSARRGAERLRELE